MAQFRDCNDEIGGALRYAWLPYASEYIVWGGRRRLDSSHRLGSLADLLDPNITTSQPLIKRIRDEPTSSSLQAVYILHLVKQGVPPLGAVSREAARPTPACRPTPRAGPLAAPQPASRPSQTLSPPPVQEHLSRSTPTIAAPQLQQPPESFLIAFNEARDSRSPSALDMITPRASNVLRNSSDLYARKRDLWKLNEENWSKPLRVFLICREVYHICNTIGATAAFGEKDNGTFVCHWLSEGMPTGSGTLTKQIGTFKNWNSHYGRFVFWWKEWRSSPPPVNSERRVMYERLRFWNQVTWRKVLNVGNASVGEADREWITENYSLSQASKDYRKPPKATAATAVA